MPRLSCQSADCNFDLTGSIRQINGHNNSNKTNNQFSEVPLPVFCPLFTPGQARIFAKTSSPCGSYSGSDAAHACTNQN